MQSINQQAVSLPAPPRGDRKVQLKSKRNFSGHMVFRPRGHVCGCAGPGQVLETESNLEMNISLILAMRPRVADLESQVLFEWSNAQGKTRRHYFDFRANLTDGSRVGVMVKRSRKLECPKFRTLVQEVCANMDRAFADRVTVMTEHDVHPIEIHNASFLDGLKERDPEADAAARRALRSVLGAQMIGALVEMIGLGGRGYRAVGRLIRSQELFLVRQERIAPEALVARRIP